MKLIHVSDTHSKWVDLAADPTGEVELIVHSGDMLPSWMPEEPGAERNLQSAWRIANQDKFNEWRAGLLVIFCAGNHDFIIPQFDGLIDCTNKVVEFGGLKFYGFPYVPEFGPWNWGCKPPELRARFEPVAKMVDSGEIDVLVCHCPPFGVLDKTKDHFNRPGTHIGNPALSFWLRHWKKKPLAILCGHVHESHGLEERESVIVSNAATTSRVLEIVR